ncbi:hypothetical protein ACFPES_29020 [Paenibacillus sp. GCM10023248]|nr:hypothetical protein [Paenibacillus sp. MAHUQ-63]
MSVRTGQGVGFNVNMDRLAPPRISLPACQAGLAVLARSALR